MLNLKQFILDNQGRAQHKAEREFNYQLIKDALDITKGNKSEAAKLLGISKTTLHTRINLYDVDA